MSFGANSYLCSNSSMVSMVVCDGIWIWASVIMLYISSLSCFSELISVLVGHSLC